MSTPHHVNMKTEADMFPVVESWPSRVDPAELLDDIRRTIHRFVVCDKEILDAVTLWATSTYLIDRAQVAPILVISAAEMRCGKTQLLSLVGLLCRRPLSTSNMTSAVVYRAIEAYGPTLLMDEADAFIKGDKGFQSILNSGHTRGMSKVWRVVGKDQDPQAFQTWGAKAIAGIGTFLSKTTLDRSIRVELRRKRPDEKAERLRHADPAPFERLRRQLARFAEDAGETIGNMRPELPDELNDRAQDNWEPLLAIADLAGGRWPEAARAAALQLSARVHEPVSVGAELLDGIRDAFDRTRGDKMGTRDLLFHLNADEEKRWATYCRGRPLNPRSLAELLREYGIQPRQLGGKGSNIRGYSRDQFEDAFARYLPAKTPESAVSPSRRTDSCPSSIPKLAEAGLAKWAPSGSTTLFRTTTKDTSAIACAHRGLSSPPAARAPFPASHNMMINQYSSRIADIFGDDLDDFEV
jgi:putative DNA primase/helicase